MRIGCGFGLSHAEIEGRIESINGLFIPSGNQVSIQIDGHLDRRVPHLFLHVNEDLALLQQESCKGVSQIMEADLAQPSPL